MATSAYSLPSSFIWRRIHSLAGLWLVLFLMEHLLTNSQAALLLGENGRGFVEMVNAIHNLPYLQIVELFLIGTPLAVHMIWGIKYLKTSKMNSFKSDGSKPSLPQYGRNRAYSWQRITSWFLLVFIIFHVVNFRFIHYPEHAFINGKNYYLTAISMDNGLYTLTDRLNVQLLDKEAIQKEEKELDLLAESKLNEEKAEVLRKEESLDLFGPEVSFFNEQNAHLLEAVQAYKEKEHFVEILEKFNISSTQVIVVANDFGTASLLTVRNTFKNPVYVVLYTLFVAAACFHGFNGLWTFMISWGAVLRASSQRIMKNLSIAFMVLLMALGVAAVWGTYWLNLRY